MKTIGKDFELVSYEDRCLRETLDFLKKWSPDHSELADQELFSWQRGHRYLALFKNRIVGHMMQIPHTFKTRQGGTIAIGWGATLVLDTSNPLIQMFAGTALLDQVTKNTPLHFAAVGVVPEIEETHKRRGYTIARDMVEMYAWFLRPARVFRFLDRSPRFSPFIQAVNLIRNKWGRARSPSGDIRRIEQFEPQWNGIWDRLLAERFEVYGVRTAEFLNYKLAQPHKEYFPFIYLSPGGKLEGYIVYRQAVNRIKDISLLKICDLAGTKRAKRALLATALCAAEELNVDCLVGISSIGDRQLYVRSGMWVRRKYPVVLPSEVKGKIHITFFDSDLDNLW